MRMSGTGVAVLWSLVALLFAVSAVSAEVPEISDYGITCHLGRSEIDRLGPNLAAMDYAGIRFVRADFDHWNVVKKGGRCDFSLYDRIVAELGKKNLTLLPILYGPEGTSGVPYRDLNHFRRYVREFAKHYAGRLPAVEFWNEPNLSGFWRNPNPADYTACLKAVYEEIKGADPSMRVVFGGLSGVSIAFIRGCYENGAAKFFDVMNVHPYMHPNPPDCRKYGLDVQLDSLRQVMSEFGDGGKPVWITEIGWPTHAIRFPETSLIRAGLKVARPDLDRWRVVMAVTQSDEAAVSQDDAERLLDILPAGSEARVCAPKETCRRLAAGDVDAVFYPFDMTFPADTLDAVLEFIKGGGTLVAVGGIPCYFGQRARGDGIEPVDGMQHGGALRRFPFGFGARWIDKRRYPPETATFASSVGKNAGLVHEPTGVKVTRYVTPDRIQAGDEFIPLLEGRNADGESLVSAAVFRYHSKYRGAAVVASVDLTGISGGTSSETAQANYIARAAGIAFAENVESFFVYHLRSFERDPYYSEHHFGILHSDFTPKPAYAAYMNFILRRPNGSVRRMDSWHNAAHTVFYPQWTRPDGKSAGMLWTVSDFQTCTLTFSSEPAFHDVFGKPLFFRKVSDNAYKVKVTDAPVYFTGASLMGRPCFDQ